MQNLVNFSVQYMFILYMNDVWFRGYGPTLAGNEAQAYSQPYAFAGEGAYVFKVRAYLYDPAITEMRNYQNKPVLDEISSIVTVEAPPAPVVLGGEVLIGYVKWAGIPRDTEIVSKNEWPSLTNIQMTFKVKNTGNTTALFSMVFIGVSNTITLAPGESGWVEISVFTPPPSVMDYTAILDANYVIVDQDILQVKYV